MTWDASDYNTVPERIAEFREKYPTGSLQPADLSAPWQVLTIGNATFIAYAAAAYRTPDDERPGIGVAYEPVPGPTAFTKNSELQNAETSAWGRAIVAALAADAKKGIATADEVRNRQAEHDDSFIPAGSGGPRICSVCTTPFTSKDVAVPDGSGGVKHKGGCPVGPGEAAERGAAA